MYSTDSPPPDTATRLPVFTVATALMWLGHDDCSCPAQVDDRANVWLISSRSNGRPTGMRALLDVEFVNPSWSRSEGDGILAEINVCTCRDRIKVELRTDAADRTTAVGGPTLTRVEPVSDLPSRRRR